MTHTAVDIYIPAAETLLAKSPERPSSLERNGGVCGYFLFIVTKLIPLFPSGEFWLDGKLGGEVDVGLSTWELEEGI